ncbi:ornithine-oxo-acid transaminase [Puccinia graminis f. sp. tritici CRL 75-36-700-3]|uniref:Ornithine aminotransferase n=1 Tax=Puccinia graminis f. sp. tritici (strain CRL 75-36-700-3 / race SCCL) TaxID=418459 RepID=E3L6H8_PUCGT|nr:ornithine-oxo-acid transaminase [Puccinia graminis f. sp. tritici CRL 75-36-700-3]EFP92153.2 ornithine-oxo-acid transaminase [Puccinia graminis f. sp. tritici CRL 75-36-700-3]
MNAGVKAVETALKLAQKWAYVEKGVLDGKAIILSVGENFHGQTLGVMGMSTDPDCQNSFGPFLTSIGSSCPINEPANSALNAHGKNTAALLLEPIQGKSEIIVPYDDYIPKVKALCESHNVLLIMHEVQTGLGQTGKLFYPVSAVLADDHILGVIKPGEHSSTFGGNPLGCAVAIAALDVLIEENLCERAEEMGKLMRSGLLFLFG